MQYDVLIIGAGAAGLAAAAELARAHVSALVLDARERIGGRIWSHHEPGLPVPVELGAEFIHGYAEATFALLAKAAAAAVDTSGAHWSLREGTLEPADALFTEIRTAMQATQVLEQQDLTFEAFLERHLRGKLSRNACAYARMLAQGFDAADTRRASARAIVEEWTAARPWTRHPPPVGIRPNFLMSTWTSSPGRVISMRRIGARVTRSRWSRRLRP